MLFRDTFKTQEYRKDKSKRMKKISKHNSVKAVTAILLSHKRL